MGPLDDPPTANKGGCGPLFWINPPGERDGSAGRVRRRWEVEMLRGTAGQGAALLPVFCWKLVLSDGSFGENVDAVLVFEAVGIVCTCSEATAYKFGTLLWRAGQT